MIYQGLFVSTLTIVASSFWWPLIAADVPNTIRETYTILMDPPIFIPLQNSLDAKMYIGSQLLFNGVVSGNGEQGTFNQKCTAMKIEADMSGEVPKIDIQEIMCQYNFCLDGRGCLFLHSGGPFAFDPLSCNPEDVPEIEASIIGGTGKSEKLFGGARLITRKRTGRGTGIGEFQFDLYYRRKRTKDTVRYGEECTMTYDDE